jgi:hypothetical protein
MKQCELSRSTGPNSMRKMVTWLAEDGLKQGMTISLKGSSGSWTVDKVHETSLHKENIHRNWNVGGL